MRLLVLVLYSDTNDSYRNMLQIQRNYLRKVPNIQYYFYAFREQVNDIEWEGDMLYVKGSESIVPGCLVKTICAMVMTRDKPFDYLLRLNISTLVDFVKLRELIATNPFVQYAGPTYHLNWTDEACGITPQILEKIRGLQYVRGIAILFKRDVVMGMMKDVLSVPMHVVDDVAFGIWCKERGISVTDWNPYNIENVTTYELTGPHFIYRSKRESREEDVRAMETMSAQLMRGL